MPDYLSVKKTLYANLKKLIEESKRTNKNIYEVKRAGGLHIVDACHVEIDASISKILRKNLTFKKKYKTSEPRTVAELIQFCGKISSTIEQLQRYIQTSLQFQSDEVISYIDTIEECLFRANSYVSKSRSSKKIAIDKSYPQNDESEVTVQTSMPFCALCWRRPFSSLSYCKLHHPSRNKFFHKQAVRKLTSMTSRYIHDEKVQDDVNTYKSGKYEGGMISPKWYYWLSSFSLHPTSCIRSLNQLQELADLTDLKELPWQEYKNVIMLFCKNNYPYTFSKFKSISTAHYESYRDFTLSLINILSGESERNIWNMKDSETWFEYVTNTQLSMTVLTMISRYEAHHAVFSRPSEYGPQKGFGEKEEMRRRIKELFESNMQNQGKPRIADIAKQVGLSRQRVNKLCNEMKLRGEICLR